MTAYLGPLGALVQVGKASALSPSTTRATTTTQAIGGGVTVWRSPRRQRQWSFSSLDKAWPNELANLQAFVDGEFGSGPFVWVDEWAQRTNLLTPRDAMFDAAWSNSTIGGQVTLDGDIVAGRHLIVVDAAATTFSVSTTDPLGAVIAPVVPGVPVTLSAWMNTTGASIRASVRDLAGTILTTMTATAVVNGWQRRSVTLTMPATAAYVRLYMTGGGRMAKPAVTWSDQVLPYHAGQGCRQAIVGDWQQSVSTAWGTPTGQRAEGSTTITEV